MPLEAIQKIWRSFIFNALGNRHASIAMTIATVIQVVGQLQADSEARAEWQHVPNFDD